MLANLSWKPKVALGNEWVGGRRCGVAHLAENEFERLEKAFGSKDLKRADGVLRRTTWRGQNGNLNYANIGHQRGDLSALQITQDCF